MMFRSLSWRSVLATIAVIAGLALAVACGSSYSAGTTSPSGTTAGTTTPAADVTITINGMAGSNSYSPDPASVKVGQTVSWRNADSIAHTATGTGFDTGSIAAGATSKPILFSSAGSIQYHCTFHPSMVGSLNVQ
jgi:plastocyanin